MEARFTVLASGSSGNAALLEASGFGLLIDCGLAPRALSHRLAAIGSSWKAVHAVILTHTHSDHWKDATLAHLRSLRVPLFAHQAHLDEIQRAPSFESLHRAKLARPYRSGEALPLGPALTCRPIPVPHDAEPTFAFRIDLHDGTDTPLASLGHASDLGVAPPGLADEFAGVDLLAVEYNHDVQMQKNSGRPSHLIRRVLGDQGHLSNVQAAEFTRDVIAKSGTAGPRVLVQLHLSRQCNTPELAIAAGRKALADQSVTIVTAQQDVPARSIMLTPTHPSARSTTRSTVIASETPRGPRFHYQPQLPGFGV